MQMRQVVVTGPYQVELQDANIDEGSLQPSEVLVQTESTFISAGTELANYTGLDPRVRIPGSWCCFPWKAGYANVGVVKAGGQSVDKRLLGKRIFTLGPHASAQVHNVNRFVTVEVPEKLSSAAVAASRMAAVSITAVQAGALKVNGWVAVFGLGMVGNLAAQMFRLMGCRVIGVDHSGSRRKVATECGISHVIGGTPEEVNRLIREITGGRMVDSAVDAVGNARVAIECIKVCADFGEVILLGTPRGDSEGNLTELFNELHARFVTVKSGSEWRIPMQPQTGCSQSILGNYHQILDMMGRQVLRIAPLITHTIKPEQIREAYEGLLHHKDEYIGVAIDWR
jgi:2-desacetyl-2-hydroxyethyl bacteriochlorophyllide A dehydrogenase